MPSIPEIRGKGAGGRKEGEEFKVIPATEGVQCQPGLQETQTATNIDDHDVIK